MKINNECESFQDRLDRLGGGPPAGEDMRELERHAAGCPECAMILEAYLHLAGPSNEELEAQVPETITGTMWPRVAEKTIDRNMITGSRWNSLLRVLVPTLAAAVVLLVFGLGLTLGELRHLRGVEERMATEIERRDDTITALRLGGGEAPGLFASERFRALALSRFFAGRKTYRIGDLVALLEQLPPDTRLLSSREVETLAGGGGMFGYSPYNEGLRRVDYSNGLDAGEAIMLIEALGIDSDELIPREQIASLRGI
jgi:hypothetical protein